MTAAPGSASVVCPGLLSEAESGRLLDSYGIPVAPWRQAASADEAVGAAQQLGYPVVVKAVYPGLAHKSDVGGVEVDLRTADEVREAVGRISSHLAPYLAGQDLSFLVQTMVRGGLEIIAGGRRDPQFGPVVMCGLGGIYTEVLADVVFLVAPCQEGDVRRALRDLRGASLLGEVRGRPRRDVRALADVLVRLGRLLVECPEVEAVDVNPLMVLAEGQGCLAVDALVELSPCGQRNAGAAGQWWVRGQGWRSMGRCG